MIQKIHSKKPVFKAKLFTVSELSVEVQPTIMHTHHSVERNPIAMVLPLSENNEVYLVSQYRYNLGKDVLECVAGYREEDEDPLESAKRELAEETGLRAKYWKKLPEIEMGGGVFLTKLDIYVAKDLEQGETNFDFSENIETIKMPLSQAVEKVLSGGIMVVSSMMTILFVDKLISEGKL